MLVRGDITVAAARDPQVTQLVCKNCAPFT